MFQTVATFGVEQPLRSGRPARQREGCSGREARGGCGGRGQAVSGGGGSSEGVTLEQQAPTTAHSRRRGLHFCSAGKG